VQYLWADLYINYWLYLRRHCISAARILCTEKQTDMADMYCKTRGSKLVTGGGEKSRGICTEDRVGVIGWDQTERAKCTCSTTQGLKNWVPSDRVLLNSIP
jgi:hypothetical protein